MDAAVFVCLKKEERKKVEIVVEAFAYSCTTPPRRFRGTMQVQFCRVQSASTPCVAPQAVTIPAACTIQPWAVPKACTIQPWAVPKAGPHHQPISATVDTTNIAAIAQTCLRMTRLSDTAEY